MDKQQGILVAIAGATEEIVTAALGEGYARAAVSGAWDALTYELLGGDLEAVAEALEGLELDGDEREEAEADVLAAVRERLEDATRRYAAGVAVDRQAPRQHRADAVQWLDAHAHLEDVADAALAAVEELLEGEIAGLSPGEALAWRSDAHRVEVTLDEDGNEIGEHTLDLRPDDYCVARLEDGSIVWGRQADGAPCGAAAVLDFWAEGLGRGEALACALADDDTRLEVLPIAGSETLARREALLGAVIAGWGASVAAAGAGHLEGSAVLVSPSILDELRDVAAAAELGRRLAEEHLEAVRR
jgi:hypothetical protein